MHHGDQYIPYNRNIPGSILAKDLCCIMSYSWLTKMVKNQSVVCACFMKLERFSFFQFLWTNVSETIRKHLWMRLNVICSKTGVCIPQLPCDCELVITCYSLKYTTNSTNDFLLHSKYFQNCSIPYSLLKIYIFRKPSNSVVLAMLRPALILPTVFFKVSCQNPPLTTKWLYQNLHSRPSNEVTVSFLK